MDDFDLTSYLTEPSEEPIVAVKNEVNAEGPNNANDEPAEAIAAEKEPEEGEDAQNSDRPSLRLVSTYGGINISLLCEDKDDEFCDLPIQDIYDLEEIRLAIETGEEFLVNMAIFNVVVISNKAASSFKCSGLKTLTEKLIGLWEQSFTSLNDRQNPTEQVFYYPTTNSDQYEDGNYMYDRFFALGSAFINLSQIQENCSFLVSHNGFLKALNELFVWISSNPRSHVRNPVRSLTLDLLRCLCPQMTLRPPIDYHSMLYILVETVSDKSNIIVGKERSFTSSFPGIEGWTGLFVIYTLCSSRRNKDVVTNLPEPFLETLIEQLFNFIPKLPENFVERQTNQPMNHDLSYRKIFPQVLSSGPEAIIGGDSFKFEVSTMILAFNLIRCITDLNADAAKLLLNRHDFIQVLLKFPNGSVWATTPLHCFDSMLDGSQLGSHGYKSLMEARSINLDRQKRGMANANEISLLDGLYTECAIKSLDIIRSTVEILVNNVKPVTETEEVSDEKVYIKQDDYPFSCVKSWDKGSLVSIDYSAGITPIFQMSEIEYALIFLSMNTKLSTEVSTRLSELLSLVQKIVVE